MVEASKSEDAAIDWPKLIPSASPLVHGTYLTDPFMAFFVVWQYEHEPENDLCLEGDFPKFLRAMCGSRNGSQRVLLSGDSGIAFHIFLATISSLLRAWREEAPPSGLPGTAAAHWCDRHPEVLERIQDAVASRSRFIRPVTPEWTLDELRPGGAAHVGEHRKLELIATERFTGQRSWGQAAQTAAYSLFGDFLGDSPELIGFCRRCDRPFLCGKRARFCSTKCAHVYSAIVSRKSAAGHARRETLRKATEGLSRWLREPHRTGSAWRPVVEKAAGLQTRDGRQSRTLGEFIRAAESPPDSPEREKLLRSLLSDSTEQPEARDRVQRKLEGFLENIRNAQGMTERSKRR
jgi:hypothetical protein